jgi:DNA-damage-inducible protein D
MDNQIVVKLHSSFEDMARVETATGTLYWYARDLQMLLGYAKWDNFLKVVEKAKTACKTSGYEAADHFLDTKKMVSVGSGAARAIEDIGLTRYACYLIAQNGDSAKEQIAFAQTYFAVQTRKQEVIASRLAETERVSARKKLTKSEKELSGLIFERVGSNESFARIRSMGDTALFGGCTTQDMKNRLRVPKGRPLADFLPTITIKAKDFANEITNFNIKQNSLSTEHRIEAEHTKNNRDVRKLLTAREIFPEKLPPAEDVKKVERRLKTEQRKLPTRARAVEVGPNEASSDASLLPPPSAPTNCPEPT